MLCDSGNCFPNSCKSSSLIQVSQIKAGDESGRVRHHRTDRAGITSQCWPRIGRRHATDRHQRGQWTCTISEAGMRTISPARRGSVTSPGCAGGKSGATRRPMASNSIPCRMTLPPGMTSLRFKGSISEVSRVRHDVVLQRPGRGVRAPSAAAHNPDRRPAARRPHDRAQRWGSSSAARSTSSASTKTSSPRTNSTAAVLDVQRAALEPMRSGYQDADNRR